MNPVGFRHPITEIIAPYDQGADNVEACSRPLPGRSILSFMNQDDRDQRSYDLVCIGSGPAGERAAVLASNRGHRVAMIESEGLPGGAMVNTGTVASKVLRETALLCSAFRRRPIPGINPIIDHSVSFDRFLARTTLVQLEEHDRIESDLDRSGVTVVRGRGRLDGPGRVTVESMDGTLLHLETKRVLLAVGSRPNRPEKIDFTHPALVDSTGILQLERMPRSLVVIGGGVIGSEYASIFAQMGVEVTIVEPRSTVMRFLDEECRELMIDQMSESGVHFKFNRTADEITGLPDGGAQVRLDDGTVLHSDVVLWALGRDGNTDDLGLKSVAIESDHRGLLKVDEHYRTTAEGVWAAGDVIGFPALASTSMEQARLAIEDMFDEDPSSRISGLLPMGIYTIPAIAAVGPSDQELHQQGRSFVVGRAPYRRNARGRMLGDDQGMMKLLFDLEDRSLLHATIVGEDATELIHLGMMMIAEHWTIEDITSTAFNYPSLGELYKSAAASAAERIEIERARPAEDQIERAA